jgi:hypothetical protein
MDAQPAFVDVSGRTAAECRPVVVELRVVLDDRHEAGGGRNAPVEFGGGPVVDDDARRPPGQ